MAAKRTGGRPNVAAGQIDSIDIDAEDERVSVPISELTLALMAPVLVDNVLEVTNNSFRDQDGRRVWTISFIGGGRLILIYSKEDQQLVDWESEGVRFERLGDQLFVLAAIAR